MKNISNAPIVGLRIDEYFYANGKEVAVGSGRLRTAIAPGEIAEITTSAELKPGINNSQLQFSQANGPVKPTAVKKFTRRQEVGQEVGGRDSSVLARVRCVPDRTVRRVRMRAECALIDDPRFPTGKFHFNPDVDPRLAAGSVSPRSARRRRRCAPRCRG